MSTVREILEFAIETDMLVLAHRVFWAISEGKASPDEHSRILDHLEYDEKSIHTMITQNILSIGKIQLFVAETFHQDVFAFYYSENVLETHELHQELFRERPKRLIRANELLAKVFEVDEKNVAEILYFHRKKVPSFPYYLGHVKVGSRLLYKM